MSAKHDSSVNLAKVRLSGKHGNVPSAKKQLDFDFEGLESAFDADEMPDSEDSYVEPPLPKPSVDKPVSPSPQKAPEQTYPLRQTR